MPRTLSDTERTVVEKAGDLSYAIDPKGHELGRTKRQKQKAEAIKREARLVTDKILEEQVDKPAQRLQQLRNRINNLALDAVKAGLLDEEVRQRSFHLSA